MRSERRKKMIILIMLLIGVCSISVGFAAFSTTLKIKSGLAITPDSSTFSVKFSSSPTSLVANPISPSSKSTGLEATTAKITNSTKPTIDGYSATFTKEGQFVTYLFYVRNTGHYTAYLNSITFNTDKTCTAKPGTDESSVNANCSNVSTKTTVKVGNITTTESKLDITGETLAPNESKLVEVTFEYLGGGNNIDGDFSVEFPSITLYYASTQGLNKPQDDPGRYNTSMSESNILALSDIYSTTLKNYRIYGSSAGVGDSGESGYIIPITVRGKNLFNPYLIPEGTIQGVSAKINNGNITLNGSLLNHRYSSASLIYFDSNTYKFTTTITSGELENDLRLYLYKSNENAANLGYVNYFAILNTETKSVTRSLNIEAGYYLVLVYYTSSASPIFKNTTFNVQLETGEATAYEPYVESQTFNITISSPLMAGDYIDFETQKVVRSNGTTENITVSPITTLSLPTTIIEVETTNAPSKIEATYFK